MYFITTKRMLEVCFFQHTPTFIIEPEKVNSSAKVNSTALLKVAYNLVIFKKKSGIYAIIQVIYGEIFCFSVWQTSCWRSVCTTKFHQPHLKNVKSLLPV